MKWQNVKWATYPWKKIFLLIPRMCIKCHWTVWLQYAYVSLYKNQTIMLGAPSKKHYRIYKEIICPECAAIEMLKERDIDQEAKVPISGPIQRMPAGYGIGGAIAPSVSNQVFTQIQAGKMAYEQALERQKKREFEKWVQQYEQVKKPIMNPSEGAGAWSEKAG